MKVKRIGLFRRQNGALLERVDPVCSKVLQYDSGSEFYELSYWILVLVAKSSNILQDNANDLKNALSKIYGEVSAIKYLG